VHLLHCATGTKEERMLKKESREKSVENGKRSQERKEKNRNGKRKKRRKGNLLATYLISFEVSMARRGWLMGL
jgi:hypothetical protein